MKRIACLVFTVMLLSFVSARRSESIRATGKDRARDLPQA
jgi:hypothetical protein